MPSPSRLLLAVALLCLTGIAGCSTVGYYWQALRGQMELVHKARPIAELIADPAVEPGLKDKLEQVQAIRHFASRELALPDNGSYRSYVDLGRPYVVWNVFAAEEFSIEASQWCFPIAGCVSYRGYFSEAAARAFAQAQQRNGLDVYVAGIPAYSTLGWLNDPVLNTFIHHPSTEVARLIFHELSHQVAYAKGDTTFNESFAVAVETEGVQRWVRSYGTPPQQQAFDQAQARRHDFLHLVERTRERLRLLYEGADGSDETRRAELRRDKARLFEDMRAEYAQLKRSWSDFSGYDWWFAQPLNNAQLASVALYTELVPDFQRLLQAHAGDLRRFYAEVERLAKLPEDERNRLLSQQ
ncbi:MAG: aminopeptidase [Burkholderiales bacterium]|nr:aminopeptidase [Burkholderiales bacterium]